MIGLPQFTATADAISVAGALSGGVFLPVVFPVNIVDCETNGDLGTGEVNWQISNPDGVDADTNPDGQEYIVPLCKTGGGSFMILDLDGTPNNCADEVAEPARDPVRRPSRSTSSPTTATTAPSRWSTRSTRSPARSC